ncbi:MAG: amidohydrolase family protein [Litorimonas sp.]
MKHFALLSAALLISSCSFFETEVDDTKIYLTSGIITVDPSNPTAEAVAVRDGKIVGVGSEAALFKDFPNALWDGQYNNSILIPGLIDPHIHMTLGSMMYGLDWVPPWDMPHPEGLVEGTTSKSELLQKIALFETAKTDDSPLLLYGYHNLVQGDIDKTDLDAISTTRPIIIWHYSGHDFYMNSAALALFEISAEMHETYEGVALDSAGELTGRIFEDAVAPLLPKLAPYLLNPAHIEKGFNGFEKLLAEGGVTTIAEMGYGIFGRTFENQILDAHYNESDPYTLYLVPEHRAFAQEFGKESASKIVELAKADPRILPQVKLFTDAAFYSQTMKLAAPGYLSGQSEGTDGLWVTKPNDLPALMSSYWDRGLDIHIHSNGDAAQDSTLSAFAKQSPGQDGQRLIIEHAGLITPEQMTQASDLGIGISAASHYVNFMGEDYKPVIAEKAEYITPLSSAFKAGLSVTVHSDAPLAPPMPLLAAGRHMTRATREGGVSTPSERLTAEQALRAVTIEAAWSLGLENEIGSIEVGKRANFTILGANPMDLPGESWGAIPIQGVMLNGEMHSSTK